MNLEIFVLVIFLKLGFSELLVDYTPPNKVLSAEVVCTDRDMQLHVLLEKPLKHPARIFVREQSADPHCVHHYKDNPDHNALMFRIPLSTCGMQRVQQHTTRFSFTTSVVVSFHKFFVSSHDRAFRITCDYAQARQPPKQDVTVGIGVDEAKEDYVDDVFPETADCSYQLLVKKNDSMMKAKTVRIGDELEHFWKCENLKKDQFIFVHNCIVNPEFTTKEDPILVDSDGCPADETGIGKIEYSKDGKSAKSRHLAYKFADYPNLLFKCSISVCRQNSCRLGNGQSFKIPPNCSKRSSRSVRQNSKNSIQLSEVVRVEESPTSEFLDSNEFTSDQICFSSLIQMALASVTFLLFCFSLGFVFCCRKPERIECHCSPARIF